MNCTAAGTVTSIVAGQSFELIVSAKDVYGNSAIATPSVSALLSALSLTPAPSVAETCSSLDDTFSATTVLRCTVISEGTYSAALSTLSGSTFGGSPVSITVSRSDASAATSLVSGSGLVGGKAGEVLTVTIRAVGSNGYPATSGGDNVSAALSSSDGSLGHTTPTVTDHGNGTYTVSYSVESLAADGSGQLSLSINGVSVTGGPWSPEWTPAEVHAPSSIITLDAPGTITAGQLTKIATIQLFDIYGNPAHGDDLLALLNGGMAPTSTGINATLNPSAAPGLESFSFQENLLSYSVFTVGKARRPLPKP